jgi:hypothetical protein
MTIAKYDTLPIQLGSNVYCTSGKILDLKGRLKAVYLNIQIRILYNLIIWQNESYKWWKMKDRERLKEKIADIMMQFWTDDEPDYERTHRYAELILKEIEKESD